MLVVRPPAGLVGDRVEVATSRPRRVAAERRLVVRVAAGPHVAAGARVRRVGGLGAGRGRRGAARADTEHVRFVAGRELFAHSLAILQHRQRRRSRLQQNAR